MQLDRRSRGDMEVVLRLEQGRYAVLEWHHGGRVKRSPPVDVTGGNRDLEMHPARWIVKVEADHAVFETAALHCRGHSTTSQRVHRVDLGAGTMESLDGTWHDRKKDFR